MSNKNIWVLCLCALLAGCEDMSKMLDENPTETPDNSSPNEPDSPADPTALDNARKCANGSIQNTVGYNYNYFGSNPLSIYILTHAFPSIDTYHFSSGNHAFDGSSMTVQVVYHASGGDQELVNETFLDTHETSFTFDAFTTPMYIATAEDSFTITITSDMVVTHEGVTQTYPHHVESIDFTLDDTAPSLDQFKVGALRIYDEDLDCENYYNPIFFLSSNLSVTPDEYDITVNGFMVTYPADPFYSAMQKSAPPISFERSFSAVVQSPMGVNLASAALSQPDITSDPYTAPNLLLSSSLPEGVYTLILTSVANVDFGTGIKTASVEKVFDFEILAGGDIELDGFEYNGKQATEFGLALFE